MGAVTCSMCKAEVAVVDGPTMCSACGFTILPQEATQPAAAEPVAAESSVPLEQTAWRGLARHQAAAGEEATTVVTTTDAAPEAPVEPTPEAAVAETATRPVARPVARLSEKLAAQPLADSIEAPVAKRAADRSAPTLAQLLAPSRAPTPEAAAVVAPRRAPSEEATTVVTPRRAPAEDATEVEEPRPPPTPVLPPDAPRKIVGQSVHQETSFWQGFHFFGREGIHVAAVGAIYLLVALTFLAIVCRPFSPKAWALTFFVALQGFSALAFAAARYLNRHARHDDVERSLLWLATPLLTCLGFNAGIVSLHSLVAGVVVTLFAVANAFLVHQRLARGLPAAPGRALQYVGTGMVAAAGLAPLLGGFPPLAACAVAGLLWQGQVLLTKRADGEAPQPYLLMKVSLLLLASALAATVTLTRGAWFHGAAALPVWGMFLTSLVLILRNYVRHDPGAIPNDYKPLVEPSVGAGLLAGFAMTLGDPVGMAVTGAIAGAATLRESLRRDRALLLLPALAIAFGIYAFLPDPRSMGITSLRAVLPPMIERLTGASPYTSYAICLAPFAIALAAAYALLVRRGHVAHARVVGACALPAVLAVCAGMVLGASRHWMVGASLAATSAALVVCGLLARQAVALIPGALGLLVGVGAAAAAFHLPFAAIELVLALTMLAVLLALGAAANHVSDFVRAFTRRWVDASTLFVMTAIPVAASAYRFAFPSELTTISNEVAIGLLAFFVAHAWRAPAAAVVASGLFGRACMGLLALRFAQVSDLQAVQIVAGASILPVVLWCLAPLFPLDRRVFLPAPPGALASLLAVWTIQAFAGWKYWHSLIGIEKDLPNLIKTASFVLVPWIAAIVVGLCVGHGRRRAASSPKA